MRDFDVTVPHPLMAREAAALAARVDAVTL